MARVPPIADLLPHASNFSASSENAAGGPVFEHLAWPCPKYAVATRSWALYHCGPQLSAGLPRAKCTHGVVHRVAQVKPTPRCGCICPPIQQGTSIFILRSVTPFPYQTSITPRQQLRRAASWASPSEKCQCLGSTLGTPGLSKKEAQWHPSPGAFQKIGQICRNWKTTMAPMHNPWFTTHPDLAPGRPNFSLAKAAERFDEYTAA